MGHPYYVLSVTGLFLSNFYLPYTFDNVKNLLGQIPLLGNIYDSFYEFIAIVFLFLISEYIKHIVNAMIRLIVKICIIILFPVIFISFYSGLIFYLALPFRFSIYLFNTKLSLAQLFDNVIIWFSNPFNSLNISIVLIIIMFLLRTSLFNSISNNINRLEKNNHFLK